MRRVRRGSLENWVDSVFSNGFIVDVRIRIWLYFIEIKTGALLGWTGGEEWLRKVAARGFHGL